MSKDLIKNQVNEGAGNPKSPVSVRWTLTALSLSMLLSSLGTSIANVALPTLSQVFNASFKEVQWVVLAYLLAITTLIVNVGRLGDTFGRRRLLMLGIFLFILTSIVCSSASSLGLLVAARAVQGLGAAAMMALSVAFIGETVPKEKTGRAMGLLGTMSAIGTAVGPSLGGILISEIGWPAIFLINVPIGSLTFLLAYFYLPVDPQKDRTKEVIFDTAGTFLLVLTLGSYALAMTAGFGIFNSGLLLVTLIGVCFFIQTEKKALSPLIDLTLFREPGLRTGLASSMLVAMVLMTTLVVGPFYLSNSLKLNPALIGMVMSVGPLMVVFTGIPIGRVVDKFGADQLTRFGLIGILTGSIMLALIPANFGIPGYLVPIVLITIGYAMFQTANNTSVMKDVRQDQRGVISGLLNLSRNLGLITGTTLMGAVFALGAGTNDLTTAQPEAVARAARITFALAAAMIFLALVLLRKSELSFPDFSRKVEVNSL